MVAGRARAWSPDCRKRGDGALRVPLETAPLTTPDAGLTCMAVDRALETFARIEARTSQVVELRFVGGLSVEETAEVLGMPVETVKRDWRVAELWLSRERQDGPVAARASARG